MFHAFALAFRQLGDRRLLAIFAKSLGVTLLIFALLGVGIWYGLDAVMRSPTVRNDGVGIFALAALAITVILIWFTFRAVAIAVIGLFGDEVVEAVEQRFYPAESQSARPISFGRSLAMGLRSVLRLVCYNLLAVPLYIVLLPTGVGVPIAFLALNCWLLGRDLGDMVAVRHVAPDALPAWRRETRWQRLGAGLLTSGLFVVPVVNFIAPVVGAAAMTHLFHRRRAA
jgi:uncharacterized protein involved in cysteine biosynthesis